MTTVARTLHDLRRSVSPRDLRRARRQAEYLGFEVIRPADDDGSASRAEAAFLHFCRRSSLPLPEVNARVGPFVADFLWREKNLIVEMDAFATHGGTTSFAEDRRRDLELRGMGFEVLRLTAEQVASEPRQVAMTLRARLT